MPDRRFGKDSRQAKIIGMTTANRQADVPRVLVVDDERNIRTVLRAMLQRAGFETVQAQDGQAALAIWEKEGPFDAVITDLKMPHIDGMELLRRLSAMQPEVSVVMITAHGSVGSAVEAVKLGAFDYIEKPFDKDHLLATLDKAVRTTRQAENHASPLDSDESGRYGLVGTSPAMQSLYDVIERVADTPSTVLITGESGTGKELVAKALHELSSRADKPFIKINCAAIPTELIESELFGYEKGAFTGAVGSKPGRFELADQGTLLLDEIAEIPPSMQVKLLRVLQENEFERVGGVETIQVDVRLVAATNRNLEEAIAQGRFREDLYYRLNVVPIRMAPLRDRIEDLELLTKHFLDRFNKRLNRNITGLTSEALSIMKTYRWPGNIRELENVMERTLLFCNGPVITVEDLPEEIRTKGRPPEREDEAWDTLSGNFKTVVRSEAQKVARRMIVRALDRTGGNVTRAAKVLGLSRKGLQIKMKELGLRQPGDSQET